MVRTGSRVHINTDGMAPLANTSTGAAGSVLGTERAKVQNLGTRTANAVTGVAISNSDVIVASASAPATAGYYLVVPSVQRTSGTTPFTASLFIGGNNNSEGGVDVATNSVYYLPATVVPASTATSLLVSGTGAGTVNASLDFIRVV